MRVDRCLDLRYTWRIGRRVYTACMRCGACVWINKPIIGSRHVCV